MRSFRYWFCIQLVMMIQYGAILTQWIEYSNNMSVSYTLHLCNDILLLTFLGFSFSKLIGHFHKTNNFKNVGIDWFREFKIYLEYLIKGLHQRKASVRCIFKIWDEALFPDTPNSLVGGRGAFGEDVRAALDALNADDVVDKDPADSVEARGKRTVESIITHSILFA